MKIHITRDLGKKEAKNVIATSHVTWLFECLESFKNFSDSSKSLIAASLPICHWKGNKN